jgi:oligopeptide transport system substrate-binding protein
MNQSAQIPSRLSTLSQQFEHLSCRTKLTLARQHLEKLHLKFPYLIDPSAFRELDRIAVFLDDDFIQQRMPTHISQLAYSIALIRKKLSLFPSKNLYNIHLTPFSLHFTFSSKPILGILAHACLKDKYEAFDEDHILLKVRKLISEAQLVKGSTYTFQPPKSTLKTLYFEIDKKSGLPFTFDEIKRLKALLKEEIGLCIEKLVPCMFMTRNEEEILKNILTLSREIRKSSDSPEVMILLDQQTSQEAVFTIIMVQVCSKENPNISELFAKLQGSFSFFPERSQIVSYLEKKHPIHASVFRIHLPKDSSILRPDLSINFYLARQKISALLSQVIGDFRDFNGGIILKQRETLSSFMETFPELSSQNSDLIETFFHSISPIESQALLPISSIKTLFDLFLCAMRFELSKTYDYFLQFHQNEQELFFMVRLPDTAPKDILGQFFSHSQSQIITTTLFLQNSTFLGYLITSIASHVQEELKIAITQILSDWKQSVKNQKILKLGFEYSVVSLDPRVGGDQMSSLILKMLFEGLMRENREGKIEYGIAESVEISPDLKTYLFKLRKTCWSDGSKVTAFDFEYAWKKVLSPSFKTPFAYLFYPIKNAELAKSGALPPDAIGIHVLDKTTLEIQLKSPTPYFLELVAHTIYSPVHHLIDQLHPNWPFEEGNAYVCNGAFQLIKNNPNQGYDLISNPLYWNTENIQLDGISVIKMTRYQAFEFLQKSNNHWVGSPLMSWDPLFAPDKQSNTVDHQSKGVRWYTFNCKKPPFNNKKMRQAFSMAIDRKQLALAFTTQPIFTPLPLTHSLIKEPTSSHFDPERARILFKEALEELALSKEDLLHLSIVHLPGNMRTMLAELIKQFWEITFNIQCTIVPLKWDDLFTRITEGNYQIGCMGWDPWVNDPMYTLNAFRNAKEPMNFSKWENSEYQEILLLAEKEIDAQLRQQYYLEAEKILIEDMPVAPIFSGFFQAIKKKNLKITCTSTLVNFKWAYFDSQLELAPETE